MQQTQHNMSGTSLAALRNKNLALRQQTLTPSPTPSMNNLITEVNNKLDENKVISNTKESQTYVSKKNKTTDKKSKIDNKKSETVIKEEETDTEISGENNKNFESNVEDTYQNDILPQPIKELILIIVIYVIFSTDIVKSIINKYLQRIISYGEDSSIYVLAYGTIIGGLFVFLKNYLV